MKRALFTLLLLAAWAAAEEKEAFKNEPAAHAIYQKMLRSLREAKSLYYESRYSWEVTSPVSGLSGGNSPWRARLPKRFRDGRTRDLQRLASTGFGGRRDERPSCTFS
jgi:hypothetical protein